MERSSGAQDREPVKHFLIPNLVKVPGSESPTLPWTCREGTGPNFTPGVPASEVWGTPRRVGVGGRLVHREHSLSEAVVSVTVIALRIPQCSVTTIMIVLQ